MRLHVMKQHEDIALVCLHSIQERGFTSGTTTKADSTGATPTKSVNLGSIGRQGSSFSGVGGQAKSGASEYGVAITSCTILFGNTKMLVKYDKWLPYPRTLTFHKNKRWERAGRSYHVMWDAKVGTKWRKYMKTCFHAFMYKT